MSFKSRKKSYRKQRAHVRGFRGQYTSRRRRAVRRNIRRNHRYLRNDRYAMAGPSADMRYERGQRRKRRTRRVKKASLFSSPLVLAGIGLLVYLKFIKKD